MTEELRRDLDDAAIVVRAWEGGAFEDVWAKCRSVVARGHVLLGYDQRFREALDLVRSLLGVEDSGRVLLAYDALLEYVEMST